MVPLQRCTNWEILLLVRLAGGPWVHMSGQNNVIFHLSGLMDVMKQFTLNKLI
jgi:hypothetical protein